MTQKLLLTSKAGPPCVSIRSRYLLQSGYLGFRFLRYQCSPWFVLVTTLLKLPFASDVERTHLQVRYFSAIVRIDFVGVYGLLHDLLW